MLQLDALDRGILDRLHPSSVEDRSAIRALLLRLWHEGVSLRRGVNRQITPELARIESVREDALELRLTGFEASRRSQLWLNFELDSLPYFFAARLLECSESRATTCIPDCVYRAERRDRVRDAARISGTGIPARAVLGAQQPKGVAARIADRSAEGVGVDIEAMAGVTVGAAIALTFVDVDGTPTSWKGEVRHARPSPENPGWQRVGVSLLANGRTSSSLIEPHNHPPSWKRARRAWEFVAAGAAARSGRLVSAVTRRPTPAPTIDVRDFYSPSGERIRALLDRGGDANATNPPIVLIPPAWGRTKETLLPLAATIVETFRRAGEPVLAVRFDGIRRRGESHNDPECTAEGSEHHRFTFSQATRDISTVIEGLRKDSRYAQSRVVLVTFSAASIDGRRAVAADAAGAISGWVSVVGSADLQSMMRVVSGGVDFVRGLEEGVSFGIQEILGVEVDIDRAGLDGISTRNAYLEDSCRDMERIQVPVTWIHGRHDAWMDLERSRLMLSSGNPENRRLVVVPTGHQLRTSREAIEVFQLISQEVSRLTLGRELSPRVPNLNELDLRRRAERNRLPRKKVDQRAFWKRYLLGRDGSLGIELMTYSSPYVTFMNQQISALELRPNQRVADFGAGTGAFVASLACSPGVPLGLRVFQLDYVKEALDRAHARVVAAPSSPPAFSVACDLGSGDRAVSIPFADGAFDCALASLFISYVPDPRAVLSEIRRTLKPGGRLVVSGLRRDADVSKLFVEANREIELGGGVNAVADHGTVDLQKVSREFLNEATRLLDLEELGLFEFRDQREMTELVEDSGFIVTRAWSAFGDPPQAVVVSATKA